MPDLDYAKVIGRFGLTVGDVNAGDVDDLPDTIWCTEGRVLITPLNTFVKVAAGSPVPWTGGNAVIECAIDSNGYLTYHGKQFVYVVDLTSSKVNPQVAAGKATHKVTFADVKADGTAVTFQEFTCRLVAAGDGVSADGVNDLAIVAPVVTGATSPIYRGETGIGVVDAAIVDDDQLQLELSDGSTVVAGTLPAGPGGSDAGVAGYLGDPDSESANVLSVATTQIAGRKQIAADLDLREWVEEGQLDNDENGDNRALFQQVIADLRGLYDAEGIVHQMRAPAGRYGFDGVRLDLDIDTLDGKFAIKGEGWDRTTFLTSSTASWLGMDQYIDGDPDYDPADPYPWSNIYLSDFTIDGSAQPTDPGAGYTAGYKGLIMHNFKDSIIERVRIINTHATGFGIDYVRNVHLRDVWAENCGRGRASSQPDPETRFGSGSGFGLGFGMSPDELIFIDRAVSKNNGAAGFFVEHLGQPEALYRGGALVLSNFLAELNAIGVNDTGIRGALVSQGVLRKNTYAGYRVGQSNASEQGGIEGQVRNVKIYGNKVGVAFEGNAGGGYTIDADVFENTRAGYEFRDLTNAAAAWPGEDIKIRGEVHHNGGPGLLNPTPRPIVGLDWDALTHDNGTDPTQPYGDGITNFAPLVRPKIRGRFYGNRGYAAAFRGAAQVLSADIDINPAGSPGGTVALQQPFDATSSVVANGNPATVKNRCLYPVPYTDLTNWTGATTTRTRETTFVGLDGVDIGIHCKGEATGSGPRLFGDAVTVTPGEIVNVSIDVLAPRGKSVQPSVSMSDGNVIAGPITRATGSKQRLYVTLVVPSGITTMRAGVIGASGATPFASGDIIRATKAQIVSGGMSWPYIDGDQPNCAWDGTAHVSTSTLTVPVYATPLGFNDQFTRVDGAVGLTPEGKPWNSSVNSGNAYPMRVSSNNAVFASGGTASRTAWLVDTGVLDGTFEAKIGSPGTDFTISFLVRASAQNDYVAVDWRRSAGVNTYRLSKRTSAGGLVEVAYTPGVTCTAGDVVQVVIAGNSFTVKVNGATLFGGAQTITDHASATGAGVLVGTLTAFDPVIEYIKFTP